MATNYIGRRRLDEVLSPEEQEMRDWEYGESLAPTGGVDLEPINVTRKITNQPNRLAQTVGSGLWKFISALGKGATGTPISMEGRGWESYLGGDIGAKLGAGIVGGALLGPETGQKLAAAAQPTLYKTPQETAKLEEAIKLRQMAPSYQLALQRQTDQKTAALNWIANQEIMDPANIGREEGIPVPNEKTMRDYLTTLSVRYPGIHPADPDIDAAIKASYAIKSKPKGFLQGLFERKPKSAKGRMALQRALDVGISEDEALDYIMQMEEEQ